MTHSMDRRSAASEVHVKSERRGLAVPDQRLEVLPRQRRAAVILWLNPVARLEPRCSNQTGTRQTPMRDAASIVCF